MNISIDPGLRRCGIAIWDANNKLVLAQLVTGIDIGGTDPELWAALAFNLNCVIEKAFGQIRFGTAVIEFPQIYRSLYQKGDQNDLTRLAGCVGYLASDLCAGSVETVLPHAWKGSVPKPKTAKEPYIIAERCKGKLSAEELGKIVLPRAARFQLDVWDAVGIGLWYLKR